MSKLVNSEDKEEAIRLRKQGKTYSEIRKRVSISKGTLSYWSRKITLSPTAAIRLKKTQDHHLIRARMVGAATLKKKQTEHLNDLRKKVASEISRATLRNY